MEEIMVGVLQFLLYDATPWVAVIGVTCLGIAMVWMAIARAKEALKKI
ncbi:hypothetical protein [Paracidovorax konjaci]|uniref:Uncharacterized protein n=1 Tax=Paracidovorax konjaci TaxID=32040 RepID=A0A1I1ZN07_9BURK|nr:hypothetical protein [Paracidovorax konjaci]SFE32738.1 hypothetical protein SAMN04489710_1314 [Paracidovorax konjaci]